MIDLNVLKGYDLLMNIYDLSSTQPYLVFRLYCRPLASDWILVTNNETKHFTTWSAVQEAINKQLELHIYASTY